MKKMLVFACYMHGFGSNRFYFPLRYEFLLHSSKTNARGKSQ